MATIIGFYAEGPGTRNLTVGEWANWSNPDDLYMYGTVNPYTGAFAGMLGQLDHGSWYKAWGMRYYPSSVSAWSYTGLPDPTLTLLTYSYQPYAGKDADHLYASVDLLDVARPYMHIYRLHAYDEEEGADYTDITGETVYNPFGDLYDGDKHRGLYTEIFGQKELIIQAWRDDYTQYGFWHYNIDAGTSSFKDMTFADGRGAPYDTHPLYLFESGGKVYGASLCYVDIPSGAAKAWYLTVFEYDGVNWTYSTIAYPTDGTYSPYGNVGGGTDPSWGYFVGDLYNDDVFYLVVPEYASITGDDYVRLRVLSFNGVSLTEITADRFFIQHPDYTSSPRGKAPDVSLMNGRNNYATFGGASLQIVGLFYDTEDADYYHHLTYDTSTAAWSGYYYSDGDLDITGYALTWDHIDEIWLYGLAAPAGFTFVSSNPADGATGVSPSTTIAMTFNKELDVTTITDSSMTVTVTGIPYTYYQSAHSGAVHTIKTYIDFPSTNPETQVTVSLSTDLKATDGDPLNPAASFSFTVNAPGYSDQVWKSGSDVRVGAGPGFGVIHYDPTRKIAYIKLKGDKK